MSFWKRRFGIVLLINFKKEKDLRGGIEEIISSLETDKEYDVRKGVGWIKRSLG